MSDFNKGDFTQQGVDGHVRATLRLNEKRYVELDLTTNENARGCTISGNVHDRLNNLDYPIGSAPSGNIAITENTAEGEPLNVSQYATATVNVAGGGTLATVEFEENGTYSPSDYEAYGFGEVTVNVPSGNNVKTLELTVNATGTTQTAPIKGPNIDENGLYNEGFGVNTASPVTVQALIKYSRLDQKYSVFLESPNIVFFTNNNTGINCVITFDSEYPKELYIDITDITQPASAVINVTTGGVG